MSESGEDSECLGWFTEAAFVMPATGSARNQVWMRNYPAARTEWPSTEASYTLALRRAIIDCALQAPAGRQEEPLLKELVAPTSAPSPPWADG